MKEKQLFFNRKNQNFIGLFGQYMVTPANNALFVINGKARTVNCEIGGVLHPTAVIWTLPNTSNTNIINQNNIGNV